MLDRFDGVQTQVLGLSVDSVPSLVAWAESLGGISYPLLSDFWPHGAVAQRYGVLRADGRSERAIFVVDKQGILRYIDVHDIDDQPDNEVLFQALAEVEPALTAAFHEQQRRLLERQPYVEPQSDLVMYCTPWCVDCREVRRYLRERQIPFEEVDVSRDRLAAAQLRTWTGGKEITPTFKLRGEVFIDCGLEALLKLLD